MRRFTIRLLLGACAASALPAVAAAQGGAGDDISSLISRSLPSIGAGQQVQGQLTTSDVLRKDGTYADAYVYSGRSGEQITVTLRSGDFDAWLIVDDPNGPMRQWNDDGAGGHDSRLTVTLPHDGRYLIVANAVGKGATGRYTLQVTGSGGTSVASSSGSGQDEWAQQVRTYMDRAAKPFFDRGYHYGGFSYAGSLGNGGTQRLTLRLGSGMTSQLMGGCDTDCSDLDLVLYDASGNKVSDDVQADDYPIVSVKPPSDAVYSLEVRMVKCKAAPCRYAIQQYVK